MLARPAQSLRLRKLDGLRIIINGTTTRAWSNNTSTTSLAVCWSCQCKLARRRLAPPRPTSFSPLRQRRLLSNTSQSKDLAAEVNAPPQTPPKESYFSPNKLHEIPLDASAQLAKLSTRLPPQSLRKKFFLYLSLSKPRLSFLTVLTTTTAYSLFPVAVTPLATSMTLSPLTLLNLCAGTALSSACANALNMYLEPAYDAKMSRTRSRPLVRGLLSSRAALIFALLTGAAGVGLLYTGVNPTVSFLSALNIVLYAGVYTPLKRISVINTWVGAIVGGIPPLMGWAAGAGDAAIRSGTNPADIGWRELLFDPATSVGGWLLAGLLFAWQFPHFYAIAYSIRHEYAAAGYKMLSSVNVRKTAIISLRYSLAMVPLCAGLSVAGVTAWAFVGTSSVVNAWMIRESWRFLKFEGAKGSARGLFWASVWHLPLILVLAMAHKKGLWERFVQGGLDSKELYAYAHGRDPGFEDDDDEDDDDEGDGDDEENGVVLKDRFA